MTTPSWQSASEVSASGTFKIGHQTPVARLGFGAMRITGKGVWGEPADIDEARRVLTRVRDLGITFVDTADSYGPEVSERLIFETLHPYTGMVIATKGGLTRPAPTFGSPMAVRIICAPQFLAV